MNLQYIAATQGLKAEHVGQQPLLERIYQPPQSQVQEVLRVYDDGSLYFYGAATPPGPQWAYLTKVREAGLAQLRTLFVDACSLGEAPARTSDMGSETFRIHTDDCAKEVVLYGVDYGDYKGFLQVMTIINGNLEPMVLPGN